MAYIIDEHQQPKAAPAASEQPKEDQDIVKKVENLFSQAKKHRKRYDATWQYNYEFSVGGRQWPLDRPRWRFNEVVNMTWSTIMTEIAIQTDSRPKFEFTSQEFGDEAFVDALKDINQRNWEKYKWSQVVQDGLFDCKHYHVAHAEVSWDAELEYGLGDVSFKMLDPYDCYWDPRASDVNKGTKCRYFVVASRVPTASLKEKYPDFEEKIKSDIGTLDDQKKAWVSASNVIYNNFDPFTPQRLPSSATSNGEVYGGEPQTLLIRCWIRDDALEEVFECEDDTKPEVGEYVLRKKYPKGRYIETACGLKLRDCAPGVEIKGEWVEYDDDCFPIVRLVNYNYPREYAGENEITHTKGPQKTANYLYSYILDCFRMQANPITIIGDSAQTDEEEITNEPGSKIHAADINQIRREPGTPIPASYFELLNTTKGFFDSIQGLQDVSRGVQDSGVNSALMLEGYVEASQTRPRMKNRNLDFFLQDAGELALKRYLQFYTQPRVFRITNKQGYPEWVEFYMPTIEDANGKPVKVAKIKRRSTIDGQIVDGEQQTVEVKGVPDVRVTSGSALPFAKALKNNTAGKMFTDGAIDQEEYLKSIDWPNYEEVLKRMDQKKMEEAQMQGPK